MSERHRRVESLVRELVAGYLQVEANTDPMITVTRVHTAPDYRQMTVFITTIPDGREAEALAYLKRSGREIRGYIKRKSNLKQIPFVSFAIDAGERHRQHIDDIAREVERRDEKQDQQRRYDTNDAPIE